MKCTYNHLRNEDVKIDYHGFRNAFYKIYKIGENENYEKLLKYLQSRGEKGLEETGFAILSPISGGRMIFNTDIMNKPHIALQGKQITFIEADEKMLKDKEKIIFNHEQLALEYCQNSGNLERYLTNVWNGAQLK